MKPQNETQQRLKSLYEDFKAKAAMPEDLAKRLSPPLLLNVPPKWAEASKKVLVIGQETLGWDFRQGDYYPWPYPALSNFNDFLLSDHAVEALIEGYTHFEFALHQPGNYNSPFWRAYREIRSSIGEEADGADTAVLWTNLFRMSLDHGSVVENGSPEDIQSINNITRDLLQAEIAILAPTAVIFFTGPNYNQHLYARFPGCVLREFNSHDPEKTGALQHPALPAVAYRTYHPGYLSRGHWHIVEELTSALAVH
ncbi:hypothetical protein N5D52_24975 [Pseudomonas sp. GD03860]|uniref:hypothetical protein n=1 Tax=Pseudomonas sp. GD03860 TaxID=2975389 RepID=UPI002448A19C|nr:hypothetical protein [Pseudomonas sp. GD03860]MDH0640186.1 hypothetical protein [Pseudomonas sp. GD03860]